MPGVRCQEVSRGRLSTNRRAGPVYPYRELLNYSRRILNTISSIALAT